MGRLHWRMRGGVFGCRRGWLRIAPFVAFVLAGYFALYGWLRVTNVINLGRYDYPPCCRQSHYVEYCIIIVLREDYPRISFMVLGSGFLPWIWPSSWRMRMIWPAVKLEIALDKYGGLPWSSIRKRPMPPRTHKPGGAMVFK